MATKYPWNKGMKGITFNTGKTHFKKGDHPSVKTEFKKGEHKSKNTEFKKGQNSGDKNRGWKGGVTPISKLIRESVEYKLWRKAVYERDNWTCIWCGSKERIEADHIKSFAHYPELRFAIDNGRTLCRKCHETTDNYANKGGKLL